MGTNASLGDSVTGNAVHAEHEANRLRNLGIRGTPRQRIAFFDDFDIANNESWSIVADDANATFVGGTGTLAGSWAGLTTGDDSVADADETYASSLSTNYIFNTTDKVFFSARVSHTKDGGSSAWVVGLSDTVGADTIVTAGTLATSLDGAVFIQEEGADVAFITSNAAAQTRTAAAYTWTNGDVVLLEFVYLPNDGVTAHVVPIVNGVVGTKHDITIAGLLDMRILMGIKTGSAAEQTPGLEVDWLQVVQETDR